MPSNVEQLTVLNAICSNILADVDELAEKVGLLKEQVKHLNHRAETLLLKIGEEISKL